MEAGQPTEAMVPYGNNIWGQQSELPQLILNIL